MSWESHEWEHVTKDHYSTALNLALLLTNSISWVLCSQRLPHRVHAAVFLSERISRALLFGSCGVKTASFWRLLIHCTTQSSANDRSRHRWTHDDNSREEGGWGGRVLTDHARIQSSRKAEAKFRHFGGFNSMCVKCILCRPQTL